MGFLPGLTAFAGHHYDGVCGYTFAAASPQLSVLVLLLRDRFLNISARCLNSCRYVGNAAIEPQGGVEGMEKCPLSHCADTKKL